MNHYRYQRVRKRRDTGLQCSSHRRKEKPSTTTITNLRHTILTKSPTKQRSEVPSKTCLPPSLNQPTGPSSPNKPWRTANAPPDGTLRDTFNLPRVAHPS